MITRLLFALRLALLLCLAAPLAAQEAPLSTPEAAVDDASPSTAGQDRTPLIDPEWESLATRVEAAVEAGRASTDVFGDLRAEVATWRDQFSAARDTNAGRIATVEAQLAALGPAPEEGGGEDPRISNRRAALEAQLERLRAPVRIAEESYARAEGLIEEIDAIVVGRQTAQLTERVGTPLAPGRWAKAAEDTLDAFRAARAEMRSIWTNPVTFSRLTERLPQILLYLALALVLLIRGRTWISRLQLVARSRSRRGRDVLDAVLSLGQILLPLGGLLALTLALNATGLFGRRVEPLIQVLPVIGIFPIVAYWMAWRLIPAEDAPRPPSLPVVERAHARGLFLGLGAVMAVQFAILTFATENGIGTESRSVLLLPLTLVTALILFRLGRVLRHTPAQDVPEDAIEGPAPRPFRETLTALLGRLLILVAAAATIGYVVGYVAAFGAVLLPTVVTLYLLGFLMLLIEFVYELTALFSRDEDSDGGLIPALIGFVIVLATLPLLALVWGYRTTDLTSLWQTFSEGFTLGETRISPSDFLTLAVVFVIGYTMVRLFQGALRSTILPKTKLDAGGQTAIISGVGYIGFFLAAVIAITTAGIDLSGLAIVAGALSVGIGFGLQTIVQNFVSGVILLIERPISQGDWIEVGGVMGIVKDISVRSTRVETFDRTDVIIPNADLIAGQVTNWTRGSNVGRLILPVGVAYGTDTQKVETILMEIAESNPHILRNPPPQVLFQNFGADALEFEIRAILQDVNMILKIRNELNHKIAKRFDAEGIEIPFAQRDIWLRNPEALRDGAPRRDTPETDQAPQLSEAEDLDGDGDSAGGSDE